MGNGVQIHCFVPANSIRLRLETTSSKFFKVATLDLSTTLKKYVLAGKTNKIQNRKLNQTYF